MIAQAEIGYRMQHDEYTFTYHIIELPEVSMTAKKKAAPVKNTAAKKLPPEQSQGRTLGKAASTNQRAHTPNVMGVAENVPESAKPGTSAVTPAQPGQHPMAPTGDGATSITVPGTQPGSTVTTEGETTTITPDNGIRQSRY